MIDALRELREKLEDYSRQRARRAGWTPRFIPTGLAQLDAVLPHGGLPSGAITEILADEYGVGSMSLAMRIVVRCAGWGRRDQPALGGDARPVCTALPAVPAGVDGRSIVLVDALGDFYPLAVCRHGLDPEQMIVVHTKSEKDALWAVDQSLRCPAVVVVIASLRQFDHRVSRRLQLAAESSGGVGLVLRPARSGIRSFAAVQMLVEGAAGVSAPRGLKPAARVTTLVEGVAVMLAASHLKSQISDWGAVEGVSAASANGIPSLSWIDQADSTFGDRHAFAGGVYPCRITLLKVREGRPAGPLWVDLHHATGTVSVHPVPLNRPVAKPA